MNEFVSIDRPTTIVEHASVIFRHLEPDAAKRASAAHSLEVPKVGGASS